MFLHRKSLQIKLFSISPVNILTVTVLNDGTNKAQLKCQYWLLSLRITQKSCDYILSYSSARFHLGPMRLWVQAGDD